MTALDTFDIFSVFALVYSREKWAEALPDLGSRSSALLGFEDCASRLARSLPSSCTPDFVEVTKSPVRQPCNALSRPYVTPVGSGARKRVTVVWLGHRGIWKSSVWMCLVSVVERAAVVMSLDVMDPSISSRTVRRTRHSRPRR